MRIHKCWIYPKQVHAVKIIEGKRKRKIATHEKRWTRNWNQKLWDFCCFTHSFNSQKYQKYIFWKGFKKNMAYINVPQQWGLGRCPGKQRALVSGAFGPRYRAPAQSAGGGPSLYRLWFPPFDLSFLRVQRYLCWKKMALYTIRVWSNKPVIIDKSPRFLSS